MTRKIAILVGIFAVLLAVRAVLLPAWWHGRAQPDIVLKVASQKGGTKALVLASGVLQGAPYRVEWSEFPSAQTLLEALGSGAIDVGEVGDAPFMFAYATGMKIKVVQASAQIGGGNSTAVLVLGNSPIHTVADLRGKRIATGRGSIGHYVLLLALERAGIDTKDVNIVFMNPADAKAAFATGAVDGWATWGPYVGLAVLHDKSRVLVDGKGLLTGVGFMAANETAITGKRAALSDFLRRLAQAEGWSKDHKGPYADVLARETGLPPDVTQYVVDHSLPLPTAINAAMIAEERSTVDHFAKAGVMSPPENFAGAFDASFDSAHSP